MDVRQIPQRIVEKTLRRGTGRQAPQSPEEIMQQAQTEMREAQARRRQQIVEAVTKKNYHLAEANDLRARVENLANKAKLAETHGDDSLARSLRSEHQTYVELLTWSETALRQAEAQADEIKWAAWRDEETLRQKTAEAIALQAEMRVLKLQKTLAAALNALKNAPAAPEGWAERKQALTATLTNYEADFADALRASEEAVAALHDKIRAPREKGDRTTVYLLREELQAEEAALTLLQEAHAKARDVRLRIERWASIGSENAAEH